MEFIYQLIPDLPTLLFTMAAVATLAGAIHQVSLCRQLWNEEFRHRHRRNSVRSPSNPALRPLFPAQKVRKRQSSMKEIEKEIESSSSSASPFNRCTVGSLKKKEVMECPFSQSTVDKNDNDNNNNNNNDNDDNNNKNNKNARLNVAELHMNHVWMSFGDLLWCYAFVGINAVVAWCWGLIKISFRRRWWRPPTPDYAKVVRVEWNKLMLDDVDLKRNEIKHRVNSHSALLVNGQYLDFPV